MTAGDGVAGASGPLAHFVLHEAGIDPDRLMFQSITHDSGLSFTTSEVAKIFFARSTSWMQVHEESGNFRSPQGGWVVDPARTPSGRRLWGLDDIERLAHALAQNGVIKAAKLVAVLKIIGWIVKGRET